MNSCTRSQSDFFKPQTKRGCDYGYQHYPSAPPERIYRAFLDADALLKWLPPHGFTGKVHQMDAKVGGSYRMSFTNFSTGHSQSFGGTYLELVPYELIRHTDKFDDPNLPGEMVTTITLKQVSCGTELNIVQEGVPGVIPPRPAILWLAGISHVAGTVGQCRDSGLSGARTLHALKVSCGEHTA